MASTEAQAERLLVTRRRFLGMAGATVAVAGMPKLARAASAKQLVVAISGGPATLDPHVTIAGTDWISLANIYDGLFMRDYASPALPARTIPGLATAYHLSPDGRTYTFALRRGVTFHDGTPWDANAAVFNLRRWFDKSFQYYYPRANATVSSFIGGVAKYDAPSTYTLRITLEKPNAGWFDYLTAAPTFFMVSPASVQKYGNVGLGNHGVGTGPFMVSEYVRNQRLVLKANPKYWGGVPPVAQLVLVPVPDDAARVAGLLSGQYDIGQELTPDSIAQIQANSQYKAEFAGKPVTFGFGGDIRSGPWSDPLVRQAVSTAIDRKAIVEQLLHGAGQPATQFYGLGNPAFDKSLPVLDPFDPTKAKALLQQSKYASGLHFKFATSTSAMGVPNPQKILEVVQSNLNDIGISSEIAVTEWTAYLGFWVKGTPAADGNDVPMYSQAMGWDTNMLITSYTAGSSQPPHGVDFVWYNNPRVNALFASATNARSQTQLIARLRAAQRLMLLDRPYIYVFHGKALFGLKKNVNWQPANTWAQRFSRATVT